MNLSMPVVLSSSLALLVVTAGAGCRLLGFEGNACDPKDATTCPSGQVCNQQNECVPGTEGEGEGEGGEGEGDAGEGEGDGGEGEGDAQIEVVADNETLVSLLARTDDGALVWATGATGGCVKKLTSGTTTPVTLHCVGGNESLAGLAVAGSEAFWVVDAASDDRLESLPLDAAATDTPHVYSAAGAAVRTVEQAGPSQLAAHESATNGNVLVAWFPAPDDFEDIERVVVGIAGHTVVSRANYSGAGGTSPGAAAANDSDVLWVEDGLYARVCIRDNTESDGDGGFSGYTDDGSNTAFADGRGWASTSFGSTLFFSTRDSGDGGGILKSAGEFDPSFLIDDEVAHQVDPDDAAKYARGLATDGSSLYYTTGGAGLASSPGVFRLALTPGSVPERLTTTNVEGSAVVVDANFITWTEPGNNRVVRIPRP